MCEEAKLPPEEETPFGRFRSLAEKVLNVSADEVKRRQESWKEAKWAEVAEKNRKKTGPRGKAPSLEGTTEP